MGRLLHQLRLADHRPRQDGRRRREALPPLPARHPGISARLPGLLQPKPGLALVCIGGNDFLRRIGEDETRANIGRILQTLQTASVPTVLVAEPHFTIGALVGSLSDHPLYGDLAETYRVPLLDGAWSEILGRRELRSDQIHANDEGYRLFAEKAADFLRRQGFFRP